MGESPPPLTFTQRHPILKQSLDDSLQLTWQQIGVPALAALGNFFVTLSNDYYANRLDFGGSLRSLLYSLGIGIGLYAFVAIVRAPFIVIGRQNRELIDVRHKVRDLERLASQSFPTSVPQEPPKPKPEANIQFVEYGLIEAHDEYGLLVPGFVAIGPHTAPNISDRLNRLVLAVFYENKPTEHEVGPATGLSARITYSQEGTVVARVNRGGWLYLSQGRITFKLNDKFALILAMVKQEGSELKHFAIQMLEYSQQWRQGHGSELCSGLYSVRVELIGENAGKIIKTFNFEVLLEAAKYSVKLLGEG